MTLHRFIAASSLAIFALAIFFLLDDNSSNPHKISQPKSDIRLAQSNLERERASGLGPSPFSIGNPALPNKIELIASRKQTMIAGGYTTPDKYFHMDIKELMPLSKTGDAFASLQLGERYWNESKALEYDPDMDYSDAPKKIAIRHFMVAIREGAGNVTAIIARRMLDDGNILEAAAWDMISQQHGQMGNQAYFINNRAFLKMSYEQLNMAQKRADEIAVELRTPQ
ncbi:hypothetical protein ACFOLJ_18960 [Rugamonas sp. CCM 8940]|uniref:hypothetical protein n=1 Tax=Rugamonas sp. CCM 8940 TaxID=2765359 RepID=UPI0018F2B8A2|nr:hypothetical protein [Rugamonas sp. CCM 8940]MBJ7310732.1 hypothetical protein [Rugamonas sp. CCM 8940]